MDSLRFTFQVTLALVLVSEMVMLGMADIQQPDIQECEEQLSGMATCLPYVQGEAKAPTPDCCNGLKQLLQNNKKCLCLIVKDGNDPQLGLSINVTLALGLPSVCHASVDIEKCPALLHLDPKSPDAQVFYRYANMSNHGATSPAPSPSGASKQTTNPGGQSASAQQKSRGCYSAKRWLVLEVLLLGILIWYFSN